MLVGAFITLSRPLHHPLAPSGSRAPPLAASSAEVESRAIRIDTESVTAVDTSTLWGGWGEVLYKAGNGAAQTDGRTALLCAVSGTADEPGAEEVIALLDAPPPEEAHGEVVRVRAECCFPKPRRMSHRAAADLPLLALTAAAALHAAGLPPGRNAVGTDSPLPATVLVAGSSGRLPPLLVELLVARGARPCVAAKKEACERLRRLGAEVVDHDVTSFALALGGRKNQPLDAILDCVGAEMLPEHISAALGAAYVSVASPELVALEQDGALAGLRARWARRNQPKYKGARVWSADGLAAASLGEVLALIEGGQVRPGSF